MGALKKHHHLGPSRSDSDWRAAKALKKFAGFIFVCSKSTIPDLDRGIFGLPGYYEDSVRNIQKGMPLFLFDRTTRRLYGVFEAASDGGYNIDPSAWESNDHSKRRHANAISKYPAQVRVSIQAERPALEEESFFSILDYVEGSKFRLELTALQVQQLLCLFDAAEATRNDCVAERNRQKNSQRKAKYHKPKSPQSTAKSDSDSYSDSSSRGLNSCEDEWTDGVSLENICHNRDQEHAAITRLSQLNLDTYERCDKRHLQPQGATEDKVGSVNYKNKRGSCKRSVHRLPYSGSDSENATLSRLQETDPAVNSESHNFIQTGLDHSGTLNRPDALVRLAMPQVPFACKENVILVPVQLVQSQQRENMSQHQMNLKQRAKWNDCKSYSSGSNPRKQGLNQERSRKLQNARYETQERPLGEPVTAHAQNCQHLAAIQQDPARAAAFCSVVVASNPDVLTCGQQQNSNVLEEGGQGMGVARDMQVLPEEFGELQNGNLPTMFMPEPSLCMPLTARFVEALHFEILQFARWTRPSMNIKHHVEAAIDCVRKGVRSVWPEADVEVFGSFATGLCLQHSDVDLAVIDAPQISSAGSVSIAQASAALIRELAATLQAYEWCESIKPLDTASMPVLKCLCRPFGTVANTPRRASTIAVDITIGGMKNSYFSWNPAAQVLDADCSPLQGKLITRHTGGAARDYVLHKIQELPALAPLVLLLKSFLHHKNLSNVYLGGLGSFSLTLLVAFYLERVAAIGEFFPERGVCGSSMPYTSLPAPGSSDLSKDSEVANASHSQGSMNGNLDTDFGGQSLGQHYVRTAADVIERVLLFWDQEGSSYLGNLLLGFLQTFGFERDLSCEKIVLKGLDGSPGGFFKRDDRHVALWIDDPLRPGVNIGAGSFGMVHVQTAFKELLQSVTKCPVFVAPLQCGDKDCQDLVAFSQLVHIGCVV